MAWDTEALQLEVASEFLHFSPPVGERMEEAVWLQIEKWHECGRRWRQTATGRAWHRAYYRRRKGVVAATRHCKACGKSFEVSAARKRSRRGIVCSVRCTGASRSNIKLITIDGESMPLVRWAERSGLPLSTVWCRISRGWDIRRALSAPRGTVRKGGG